MTLHECCALAQDMTRIPITVLQTSTDCMLFCTQYQFHPLRISSAATNEICFWKDSRKTKRSA